MNGRYTFAETAGDSVLLAHAYCRRGGSGCGLLRRRIDEFSGSGGPWGSRKPTDGNWYERREKDFGNRLDPLWRSMAVRKDARGNDKDILLAVGKRGMLVLPVDFNRDTTPSFLPAVDGPVLAVRTFADGSVWSLVGGEKHSQIVKVGGEEKVALPGNFDTFL